MVGGGGEGRGIKALPISPDNVVFIDCSSRWWKIFLLDLTCPLGMESDYGSVILNTPLDFIFLKDIT